MTNVVTLDTIRANAEAKYGATIIELAPDDVVKLLNPLRLPKHRRDELMKLQETLGADDADQEAGLSGALRLVAEDEHQADRLLSALGGDLALLAQVFEQYTEGTQMGEASASRD